MTAKKNFDYRRILALIVFCLCLALALPVQAAKNDEPVTTVILVRHGQTDYNKENRYQGFLDIPLNEKGLAQADQLAASLKDVHIDVFIASPLKRAYVTTEKCAKDMRYSIYAFLFPAYPSLPCNQAGNSSPSLNL